MAKQTRWEQLRNDWTLMTLYQRFESIVALVLTVVIALVIAVAIFHLATRFNHTLQFVVARQESIIQTKVVLLISLLALARKVIVLELDKTSPGELAGLAALTLALGIVYWLMRERDDRLAGVPKQPAN